MRHSAIVPWRHCPISESSSRRSAAQIGQLPLHIRKMLAGYGIHGLAGLLFLVGEIEQRPNLLDGKAEVAGAPGEGEAAHMRGRIVAVIARPCGAAAAAGRCARNSGWFPPWCPPRAPVPRCSSHP